SGALMLGVLPAEERQVGTSADRLNVGSFDDLKPAEFGIVLGAERAKALEVSVGERVVVVTSMRSTTPAGVLLRHRVFKVVGTFSAGMYEYDRNLAYVYADGAARLHRLGAPDPRLSSPPVD